MLLKRSCLVAVLGPGSRTKLSNAGHHPCEGYWLSTEEMRAVGFVYVHGSYMP